MNTAKVIDKTVFLISFHKSIILHLQKVLLLLRCAKDKTGETDFTVRMSAADVPYAPLLNVGDRVCVWYYDGHVSEFWIEACDLELLPVSTPAEPDDAQPSGGVDA